MAFENNRYLQDIVGIQGLANNYVASSDAIKQKALQQEFQQQAPQLLAQSGVDPNLSQLAGLGLQAGNESAYDSLLKSAFAKPDKSNAGVGVEQATLLARALGVDSPEVIQAAAALPLQQAQMLANQARTAKSADIAQGQRNEGLGLQRQGQQRLQEKMLQDQRNLAGSDLKALEKDFNEQEKAIRNVKSALSKGSQPSQSIVENFTARTLAGEKGPLSNEDRAALKSKAAFNTYQDMVNYVTGTPVGNWTDDQRAAFQDLVNLADKNFDKDKTQKIMDWQGRTEYQKLASGDDYFKKTVDKTLSKYGIEKDPTGNLVKKISEKKVTLGQETPIGEYLTIVKDEALKADIQGVIDAYKGKPIPKNIMDSIRAEVEAEAKANGQ